jgi:transposase
MLRIYLRMACDVRPPSGEGRPHMGRPRTQRPPLPPIWEASDELWAIVQRILDEFDPPQPCGRHRIDQRAAFDAIIYRLRTGCQWNHLPPQYPDDSSVHRTFQRWVARSIFDRLWADVQERCEDLDGCDWEWQAADAALGKARKGGTRLARIPRTAPKTE